MADNYLERQREAYEARKAAWLKAGCPQSMKKKARTAHQAIPAQSGAEPEPVSGRPRDVSVPAQTK